MPQKNEINNFKIILHIRIEKNGINHGRICCVFLGTETKPQ